jgi:hypothetical protein
MKRRFSAEDYSSEQAQLWAEHWLERLRDLPRVVTSSDLESLRLLIFGAGKSWGIADGAARIRYLVGSKLIRHIGTVDQPVGQSDDLLEKAFKEVIADGEVASEELARLAPGLLIGTSGQRAPCAFDLRRMALEYKSGFALSPLTIHFCEMHSIYDGAKLISAVEDENTLAEHLNTIRMLANGRDDLKD